MLRIFFPTILWLISTAAYAEACNPYVPRVCESFTKADAVFIGTLTTVEEIKTSATAAVLAQFSVERVFKGTVKKVEVIKFGSGDCDPKLLDVGEKYFVYKMPYEQVPMFGNLTGKLKDSATDFKYAQSVSWETPRYEISGWISGLDAAGFKSVRIQVENGDFQSEFGVDNYGFYSITVKQTGTYKVKISLPIKRWLRINAQNSFKEYEGPVLEYAVEFKPNECDYRQIEILNSQ